MFAELEQETRNYEGPEICTLKYRTDPEAAEVIKFFVDTLMGRTKPVMTDQGDVTKR